ncbi:MAG: ATP-binding protein [Cyclobacteriaceae bacterium]
MIKPIDHQREEERLKELESYSILDTLPESDFDNLTAIAATICGTPISLVSLLDDKRQWFKSHHGIDVSETSKELAFCAHAINTPERIFQIKDARKDDRFHDNPIVANDPYVIFYAGVPLITKTGLPLGTLCVIDHKPKELTEDQLASLDALSKQVMNLFELRKSKMQLEKTLRQVRESNQSLARFATMAAHDLKSPLNNISMLTNLFLQEYGKTVNDDGMEMLEKIKFSSLKLKKLIEGLLQHSKSDEFINESKVAVNLESLVNEIKSHYSGTTSGLSITLNTELSEARVNQTILYHVLLNLVSNAVKYNDKENVEVEIGVTEDESFYYFFVRDNGPGIDPKFQEEIFEIFRIVTPKDRFGVSGNGIGLATVKKLIENSEGTIQVDSEIDKGTTFSFTLKK